MCICQLVTAALLFGLYNVQRTPCMLVLAAGYLCVALMVVPWALTFPGAFPAFGLDERLQATASLAAINRIGFPLIVLLSALISAVPTSDHASSGAAAIAVTIGVVSSGVAVFSAAVLFSDMPLPPFMLDRGTPAPLWRLVPHTAFVLCFAGIAVLIKRRRSVLDLWLVVVLASLLIEILLINYLGGGTRLTLGWWAGRLYGLAAASVVLVVLLFGITALYARLARSIVAERRSRENRLTMMEVFSAALADEMRQPLISVVLSAAAGRRWLARHPPDLDEANAALTRIEAVGERAGQLVETLRTTFRGGARPPERIAVEAIAREVLARCREEARLDRVAVRTAFSPVPAVTMEPASLELILSNLITNAIDAMAGMAGPRTLSLDVREDAAGALIAVADTGPGLDAEAKDRIFTAFYTTKADGMGIGLTFCRVIVEAAGGRLTVNDNMPSGAVFSVWLPASDQT